MRNWLGLFCASGAPRPAVLCARRADGVFATLRGRLADERGHIGVLMAFVIFVVIGSLMMTWNTAQLSKEKMRLQNAADSAALGFCVWQARGMNTLQNINDDMYVALSTAQKLLVAAASVEAFALGFDAASATPFVGWLFKILAVGMRFISGPVGGLSGWLSNRICAWLLNPLGYFYAYGTTVFAYWGAQQLAAKNRADPLGNADINLGSFFGNLGLYAIGVSIPLIDTVKLPVAQKEQNAPWKYEVSKTMKLIFDRAKIPSSPIYKICATGSSWNYKPWVSKRGSDSGKNALPGPTIWIAHKYYTHIEALPLTNWTSQTSAVIDKWPMVAIAAAQCVTGDLVPHSVNAKKGKSQRPAGFGTGATAKLIPVATAFNAITTNKAANAIFSKIICH